MSFWSWVIWACLASMASVISFMVGTVPAELEGVSTRAPSGRRLHAPLLEQRVPLLQELPIRFEMCR